MESTQTAEEQLISQALAEGIITEADLNPPPAGLVATSLATVSKVAPAAGPLVGGQIVAITGKDFAGTIDVTFGLVSVDPGDFAVASSLLLVVRVPDADAGGAVAVKVENGDGVSTSSANYVYGAPTVTKLDPAFADPTEGGDGGTVTITGSGFLGAVNTDVVFGTEAALDLFVVSDTQMVATTPMDDSGNSLEITRGVTDVVVTRNSIDSATTANTKFLFSEGAPVVTTLGTGGSPITGTAGAAVGSLLTITGTELWGVNKVMFGNTAVTKADEIVVANDGLTMTVKVPTRAVGPVDVIVSNVIGASTTNLATRFDYIATVAPTIKTVTPNVLAKEETGGGGSVLVTGTGFTGVTAAKVTIKCTTDLSPDAVVVASDASLIVTAPGNAGDVAEDCDLEIQNPSDNTKKATMVDAIHYV